MDSSLSAAEQPICGLVMPISAIDGCAEAHWVDVRRILSEAILEAGFSPVLVSDADEIGIIHKRIIQNLYDNPIVVCDVSAKNPNVMFELGMRLAFNKPTIIVKDDKTPYNFDTAPIEHVQYPRDLRFPSMVEFKKILSNKIIATHRAASTDANYTTFLKHFGEFTVAKIDKKEVEGYEKITEEIRSLRLLLDRREIPFDAGSFVRPDYQKDKFLDACLMGLSEKTIGRAISIAREHTAVRDAILKEIEPNHFHLEIEMKHDTPAARASVRGAIDRLCASIRTENVQKK